MSFKFVIVGAVAVLAFAAMALVVISAFHSSGGDVNVLPGADAQPTTTAKENMQAPGGLTDRDIMNAGLLLAGLVAVVILGLALIKAVL